jgi:uncharacterized protein (TIGR02996 family)
MNTAPDPTRDALHAAICAHPDEDTPRLVYADYIEEHGDSARAEFIRAQCRLATMNEWDDGYTALEVRCRRLLAEHPDWYEPLRLLAKPPFRGELDIAAEFARGFPERVELTVDRFLDAHERLFAAVPLRTAEFSIYDTLECAQLAAYPALGRLRGLDIALTDGIMRGNADESLRAFATSAHLAGLDRLRVRATLAGIEPLQQLVESPHLRPLRAFTLSLSLRDPPLDPTRVARWKWFPNLRELAFEYCYQCDELVAQLLRKSAWLPQLERLSLPAGHNDSGLNVFTALGNESLSGLVDLRVERVHAHPDVLAPVRKLTRPQLQSLRLPDMQPGFVEGGKDVTSGLFRVPWLSKLQRLELSRANLLDDWLIAVADAPFAKTLRVLDLHSAVFEPKAYRNVFARKRQWPELQKLNLWFTNCPEEVLAALVDHPGLPKLVSLTAGRREPAPKFLMRLAKSPASARFRELDLSVKMDDATAAALLKSQHLENIDVLKVMKGTASRTACNRLLRRFGARITITANR